MLLISLHVIFQFSIAIIPFQWLWYIKFSEQWVSTNNPGGNASSVSLPIAYRQWYKIVATGVVNSSDGDFKQTVAVLKDYNWSMSSFALRTSGSDRPAAFCITIGV